MVEAALERRKAFAVVPCCVFSETFPERHLISGEPVTTYEELLDYLQGKDAGIRRTYLPFHGRNTVLYFQP